MTHDKGDCVAKVTSRVRWHVKIFQPATCSQTNSDCWYICTRGSVDRGAPPQIRRWGFKSSANQILNHKLLPMVVPLVCGCVCDWVSMSGGALTQCIAPNEQVFHGSLCHIHECVKCCEVLWVIGRLEKCHSGVCNTRRGQGVPNTSVMTRPCL